MKHLCKTILICSAGLALVGCRSEIESQIPDPGSRDDGALTFKVGENATTKSTGKHVKPVVNDLIPFDEVEGNNLFLEETVMSMDDLAGSPATKGTPMYTENFGTEHPTVGALAYLYTTPVTSTDTVAVNLTEYTGGRSKTLVLYGSATAKPLTYKYDFATGIWPDNVTGNLLFFLSAPDQVNGDLKAGVKSINYFYTKGLVGEKAADKGVIRFTYQSPAAAADQEDILFSTKSIDRDSYNPNSFENASILFYHTLAGVKFKVGNDSDEKISIKSVTLTKIKNAGSCTVNPMYDDEGYNVSATNPSNKPQQTKKSKDVSKWSNVTGAETFSLNNLATSTAATGKFADSFYANGMAEDNYMDADFTNVFYFVPQTTAADATITVNYTITVGENVIEHTKTIPFNGRKWFAGEIYTYTLTIKELGVYIKDEMNTDNSAKSDVAVTNTHNTTAYIRAAVIGNWFDSHEYATATAGTTDGGTSTIVAPGHIIVNHTWKETDAKTGGNPINFNTEYWTKGADGFWYYLYPVKGGVTIPESRALFTYYETPGAAKTGSHLEMTIAVQAVDYDRINETAVKWDSEIKSTLISNKEIIDEGAEVFPQTSTSGE